MTHSIETRSLPDHDWPTLAEIEDRVCAIAAEQLRIPRANVQPASRLVQDLNCDSLELVELMMSLEEEFCVTIDHESNLFCKAVFTRQPFRLSDLSETIYIQRGTGKPERKSWRQFRTVAPRSTVIPFTQLGGIWRPNPGDHLFEQIEAKAATRHYRRRSDGMRCVQIPAATAVIGTDRDGAPDEGPQHSVHINTFLIDAEPVSTTAYCRFLNTVGKVGAPVLEDWFLLTQSDKRHEHALIEATDPGWRPIAGSESWPMILVSWFGANAYSLWANGRDWANYRGEDVDGAGSFLPTEAQWEYAARGGAFHEWPWGDDSPSQERIRYGQHSIAQGYAANALPLAGVNEELGMSPFGLHHMAGNVWQWCRDWYSPDFYRTPAAIAADAVNTTATQVRSERGGSWVGPAELCRSSYRRGRPPEARGRCLGFRCVSDPNEVKN